MSTMSIIAPPEDDITATAEITLEKAATPVSIQINNVTVSFKTTKGIYTAVKEITRLYPEVPVLAFTATLVDHEMFDNLKQMGFVDAMLKPFQPMELFSKIRYYAN